MRQVMDVSQERDDAVAAREAAVLELRSLPFASVVAHVLFFFLLC
jgi:hypothetical protein